MGNILGGLVTINGIDIWTEYGAFLVEDKRGGMENLASILTPSEAKDDVPVDMREENGERYSQELTPRSKARDVELRFAIYNATKAGWLQKYFAFINMLKQGNNGWLDIHFAQLGLTLRVKYKQSPKFTPLTYLWTENVQAGKFRVKFREPNPII